MKKLEQLRDCLEFSFERITDFVVDSYWAIRYFFGCRVDIEIHSDYQIVFKDKIRKTDNFATIFFLNCSPNVVWMVDLKKEVDFIGLLNLLEKEGLLVEKKEDGIYYSKVKMKTLLNFFYNQ